MGRTDDPQEPQEYQHDHHGVEVEENQPTEIVINYNLEQQGSYNGSNPMEPQVPNLVQDQYAAPQQPAQYPPPQQPTQYPPPQQPAQYPPPQQPTQYPPPQQNTQMGTPPPNYPPPGLPTQYPPTKSPQPMQFPPPASQEAHQPAVAAYNQFQPIYNQYNVPQYAPQPSPQMGAANYNTYNIPQSPHKPASGVPMPNQFPNPVAQAGTQPWKTGLFDCMEDPQNAILTACVPCLTFGQIAEIIDNGHTTCATSGLMYGCVAAFIGIPCILSCTYRTKLRSRFGLVESPAPDWITHCLCEWCALCQAYRELNMRGLDPSIGWQGNLAKSNMQQQQQQQMRMMPPTNQTMNY